MKYFISVLTFSLILLVLIITPLSSQSLLSNVGVNFSAGVPVSNSHFKRAFVSPEIDVYWSYQFLTSLDLKFLFGYGKSVVANQNNIPMKSLFVGELLGVYSFPKRSTITPFFQFGFGAEYYTDQISSARTDGVFIGGCGVKLYYRNNLSFLISSNLRYHFGDFYPKYYSKLSDIHFCFKTGIQYDFSPSKVKNKFEIFEAPNNYVTTKKTVSDSSHLDQLKLYHVLSNNVSICDETLKELSELIKVQNRTIETLDVQLANAKARMEKNILAADFETEKNPVIRFSQVKILYENALKSYNSKDYLFSISILTNLKKNFPYHPLFGNFVYWIGECYFGLRNYKLAIQAFEEVQKREDSSKDDDAMIMTGICYYRLGDYLNANKIFQKILKIYPNSEYKHKSKKYLALLAKKIIY